ncbi:retropepsin-like aspartic protease [Aquimarina spongiae]|uniref:Aspartyl protease n=1 Tax=Aquimarina spongiae TaxID=570521 RepID=A0A1M6IFB7_9FLAO|nr:retropepsin-like aspartic protease [Aquimarina spongiae]SHJ33167.1 Aspartyl protease [Aquimarina spongiae]
MITTKKIAFFFLLLNIFCFQQNEVLAFTMDVPKSDKNFTTEISYRIIGNLNIIPVEINNNTYQFIFDTGARTTVVNSTIINQINHNIAGTTNIKDANKDTKELKKVAIPKIRIGEKEFKNPVVISMPTSDYFKRFGCEKIDGIIGYDIIKKVKWKIDPKNKKITLSDQIENFNIQETQHKFKLKTTEYVSYIDTKINGSKTKLKLDTGFNKYFCINYPFYEYLKSKSNNIQQVKSQGWVKTSLHGKNNGTLNTIQAESIQIGDITLENQIIYNSKNTPLLLGNGFLNNFITIIDIQKKQLFLDPIKSLENEKIIDFDLKIGPDYQTNRIIVKNIFEEHSLETTIKPGSQIIGVNSVDVSNFTKQELCDFWNTQWKTHHGKSTIRIEIFEEDSNTSKEITLTKNQILPRITNEMRKKELN